MNRKPFAGLLAMVLAALVLHSPQEARATDAASALPVLSVAEVVARTLENHPALSAAGHESTALEHEIRQAGVRPNPELSLELENFGGSGEFSGTDRAEATLRLSQRLELGGKRSARQDVARSGQELGLWQKELVRIEVASEAVARFLDLVAAQQREAVARDQVALNESLLSAVEERIAAGKSASIEKKRFSSRLAEARLELRRVQREVSAARQVLALSWHGSQGDFIAADDDFLRVAEIPDRSKLLADLESSPAVQRANGMRLRTEQELRLARAEGVVDPTLSLGVRRDEDADDHALVAEISVPLPLFDRNRGAIAAVRSRLDKAREEENAARLDLERKVVRGWSKLDSAYDEVVSLHDEVIPAAEETFEGIRYGYQAGKFGLLDVLDAEQSLFAAKSLKIDALLAYHRAVLELERLLGRNVPTSVQYLNFSKYEDK
ncbi:MAG TPA: TolC family protein [Geoalkalibacter subterraneus]|uniref:TolC family protein n=1 Tax=Geoalkalibacter subterraneus TaxID=483547 RepID=A0A831LQL0_9BACT|nr:TolC family protein [Geoalkalibacter subterraneus]